MNPLLLPNSVPAANRVGLIFLLTTTFDSFLPVGMLSRQSRYLGDALTASYGLRPA